MDDLVERLRRKTIPTGFKDGVDEDTGHHFLEIVNTPDPDCTEAADEITVLRARLEAVKKERDNGLRFDLVRFENGQFDFRGGPVPAIAEYFAQMFEVGEGTYFNHMEIEFDHPKAGPMILSAQRRNGQTPNQQRLAAEARAERAEAALAAARRDALEDAAEIAESHKPSSSYISERYWRGVDEAAHSIAVAIRALIAQEDATP